MRTVPTIEEFQAAEEADWITNDGRGGEKLMRGKIVQIERGACSLEFPNGNVRKFRFNVLRPVKLTPPPERPKDPEPQKMVRIPPKTPEPTPLAEVVAEVVEEAKSNGHSAHSELLPVRNTLNDVEAFLAMGKQLEADLRGELAAIPGRREVLKRDLAALDELEANLKQRLERIAGPSPEPKEYRYKQRGGYTRKAAAERNEKAVALVDGFLTVAQIAQKIGAPANHVSAGLYRAWEEGKIVRVARGVYAKPGKKVVIKS